MTVERARLSRCSGWELSGAGAGCGVGGSPTPAGSAWPCPRTAAWIDAGWAPQVRADRQLNAGRIPGHDAGASALPRLLARILLVHHERPAATPHHDRACALLQPPQRIPDLHDLTPSLSQHTLNHFPGQVIPSGKARPAVPRTWLAPERQHPAGLEAFQMAGYRFAQSPEHVQVTGVPSGEIVRLRPVDQVRRLPREHLRPERVLRVKVGRRQPRLPQGRYCSFSRRSVRTISMTAATVSWRAQSRCSSTVSETQLIGCPPAWITRSRPARWASGEVPPIASTTG